MAEHRPGDRVVAAPPEGLRPAKGWTKASLAMAHALATTELVQYALGRRREVTGHLLSWRIDTALRTRHAAPRFPDCRSEGRRVGKERVSTCRSWWSPIHE